MIDDFRHVVEELTVAHEEAEEHLQMAQEYERTTQKEHHAAEERLQGAQEYERATQKALRLAEERLQMAQEDVRPRGDGPLTDGGQRRKIREYLVTLLTDLGAPPARITIELKRFDAAVAERGTTAAQEQVKAARDTVTKAVALAAYPVADVKGVVAAIKGEYLIDEEAVTLIGRSYNLGVTASVIASLSYFSDKKL